MVINIKNETGGFEFIGSRGAGEIIRKKMKKELDKGHTVTLDFCGVEQITQSFIDARTHSKRRKSVNGKIILP